MKILVLDNYDSFVYNLVHIIEELGYKPDVVRNDKITLEEIEQYDKILLSPGPGIPEEAGIMPELLKTYGEQKDIFGVCLGHQAIAEAFGGSLINISEVLHGIADQIKVLEPKKSVFEGLPKKFNIGHYHSWVVNPKGLPKKLAVTAKDSEGHIMGIRHKDFKVQGVQFHPESILTEHGKEMIKKWLES
jgi:anthranilate synthase component 2